MKVRLKSGDEYIEVDTELSSEMIDTLDKLDDRDLEDTLELKLNLGEDVE